MTSQDVRCQVKGLTIPNKSDFAQMDISHVPLGLTLMDERNNKVFKSRSPAAHPSCQPETGGLEISGASPPLKVNKKPRLAAAAGDSLSPRCHLKGRGN